MEKKFVLTINDEIVNYCKLNNIEDIIGFGEKLLNEGFMKIKYPKPINNDLNVVKVKEEKIINKKNIYEE